MRVLFDVGNSENSQAIPHLLRKLSDQNLQVEVVPLQFQTRGGRSPAQAAGLRSPEFMAMPTLLESATDNQAVAEALAFRRSAGF